MKSIEYYGKKTELGPCRINVKVVYGDERVQNEQLKHIVRHSPDGFQMGYGGSGPSDLALSILTDYCMRNNFDENIVESMYQDFKVEFVVPAKEELKVTGEEIKNWLNEKD
jgi:hypothetical protein